jgi:G:T/U-mismatch repair DNA glycosylase
MAVLPDVLTPGPDVVFCGPALFVPPSTSGAARAFRDETHWQSLTRFVRP